MNHKQQLVCNYAPLRFLPYRETGEFVNVGVALQCPQTDYFGFKTVPLRKHGRVTHFFPELEKEVYREALRGANLELDRFQNRHQLLPGLREVDQKTAKCRMLEFDELVRHREGIIHFGPLTTMVHRDPEQALKTIFFRFVERQFAQTKEYQETVMRNQLATFLQDWKVSDFFKHNEKIGTDDFKVLMPFVHYEAQKPHSVIKPLDLDRKETTDIFEHGGAWVNRLNRLKTKGALPEKTLLTVQLPKKGKRRDAAEEILRDFDSLGATSVDFADRNRIRNRLADTIPTM